MNLRQVRQKIKSIGNVKKITKAMQMVAAVKMRKAQDKARQGRFYRDYLRAMIIALSKNVDKSYSPLFTSHTQENKRLVILISSNKGLCGSFNSNLFKHLYKKMPIDKDLEFITLGKKGVEFLRSLGAHIDTDFSDQNFLISAPAVFQQTLDKFLSGKVKEVYLCYNKFISSFKSESVLELLLPITADFSAEEQKHDIRQYLIEPSPKEFLNSLLNSYLEDRIRAAVIDSEAGEHSARMMAMKNATENAADLIYHLTLLRNKLRQEKITYELLDMITAKESVEVIN